MAAKNESLHHRPSIQLVVMDRYFGMKDFCWLESLKESSPILSGG
jgi:hypothetical protein